MSEHRELTEREKEMARMVANGVASRAKIGRAMGIDASTVSVHLSNIYRKLAIGGPGAATRLALWARENL